MRITLEENGTVAVSASYLAAFANEKARSNLPPFSAAKSLYKCENALTKTFSATVTVNTEQLSVVAKNQYVIEKNGSVYVEKVKRQKKISKSTSPSTDLIFTADTMICALAVCKSLNVSKVNTVITFESDSTSKSFSREFDISYLLKAVNSLAARAYTFIKIEEEFISAGKEKIKSMPFPYSSVRDGQKELIKSVYKCAVKRKRLISEAPTGIGKTVSVLYPAVKAIGAGTIEKSYYLTAKTSTGKAALDAVRRMNIFVPQLRAVAVSAKEKMCPVPKDRSANIKSKCRTCCPLLGTVNGVTFSRRLREAEEELLKADTVYEKETIKSVAERHKICPYELSVAACEYCQIIICDYNYIFDSKIRFKRLSEESSAAYMLLIDEAHNLPDRTREMYSAQLSVSRFKELVISLSEFGIANTPLADSCKEVISSFEELKEHCKENEEVTSEGVYGYGVLNTVPQNLIKKLSKFCTAAYIALLNTDNESTEMLIDGIVSNSNSFIKCSEVFDEKFVLFCESKDGDVTAKIMCLDPSTVLNKYMSQAASTVLFSATLSPLDYFADIAGCNSAEQLRLDSPYNANNLCLAAVDSIGTTLTSRNKTADSIAEVILTAVCAKSGNYMVYCPSYSYMNLIVRAFLATAPKSIKAVAQKPGMSSEQEKRFLSFFRNHKTGETLVGFCVMGGSFSEGIDLPSDMLIGVILVGIGLPGLSSKLNILKEYYDRTRDDGYNFAYLYPAVTKILQAVGRVIRGEDDRGVAVLIDDRYRDPNIRKLFPSHWKNMHYIGDTYSLSKYISDFWEKQ